MERRTFIKSLSLAAITMNLSDFSKQLNEAPLRNSESKNAEGMRMPVLFVGHGNPMNAIEKNEFSEAWIAIGKKLPKPKAILCISAHWQTRGTRVNALEQPGTIHDFGGFPQELYDVQYPAPGAPDEAKLAQQSLNPFAATLDYEWGLDHGCWSVLRRMFPDATVPVFQLSLDYTATPEQHFELAKQLKTLRSQGVLIMGSGNIVHNLGMAQWKDGAYDWAISFDEKIKGFIETGDAASIVDYHALGREARLSIPTNEHYLPLLYTLALREQSDDLDFFNEKVTMGSVSMRGLQFS